MGYVPRDLDYAVSRELKRRRSSDRTTKSYLYWIHRFLEFSGKTIDKISKKEVREFLYYLDENKKLAGNTLNVAHMAIRFLFEEVLDKKIWIDIKYSKVPKQIQRYLTKEDIIKLLGAIRNPKHRLMISLLYSAGLRVSELINLKIGDLHFNEGYGFVRNGKGGKDRVFVIADKIKQELEFRCRGQDIGGFVFLTNRKKKYSVRTIQAIVKKASCKAGIANWKEVHPHTLRHSFATHLIQENYSITDVQASLGHKSPETTMVYSHASGKLIGIKSPLDRLQ